MDLIEDHKGQSLSDAVDGLEEMESLRVMVHGGPVDVSLEVRNDVVVVIDELEIDGDASLNRYVREALHDSLLIDLMGELLAELRKVVLAVGVLDVRQ